MIRGEPRHAGIEPTSGERGDPRFYVSPKMPAEQPHQGGASVTGGKTDARVSVSQESLGARQDGGPEQDIPFKLEPKT